MAEKKKDKPAQRCVICTTPLTDKNTAKSNPYICKSCMGFEQ